MKFLITGGAGYIGSTVASALEDAGHTPVILDSLVTGRMEFTKGRIFYQGDIADRNVIEKIFSDHPDIYAVLHCAALIVVPESVTKPYEYYRENVSKSNEMFHILNELGCKRIVFSSSAAIYDKVEQFMVTEEAPLAPSSPYARTKFIMEMVLKDTCRAYGMKGIALRYFNPIGADPKYAPVYISKNLRMCSVNWLIQPWGNRSILQSPAQIGRRATDQVFGIIFTSGIWRQRICKH